MKELHHTTNSGDKFVIKHPRFKGKLFASKAGTDVRVSSKSKALKSKKRDAYWKALFKKNRTGSQHGMGGDKNY